MCAIFVNLTPKPKIVYVAQIWGHGFSLEGKDGHTSPSVLGFGPLLRPNVSDPSLIEPSYSLGGALAKYKF